MHFRYPAVPLVTHSPYFSLWAMDDVPNRKDTCHWTGKAQPITGTVEIGKRTYRFLGDGEEFPMAMRSVQVSACSTTYEMECPEAVLYFCFTSPLLLNDLALMARPITYLTVSLIPKGKPLPTVKVTLTADSAICLDHPGQHPVVTGRASGSNYTAATLASATQNILNCKGDDLRIDWGTFYLATAGGTVEEMPGDNSKVCATGVIAPGETALFAMAYDEVKCIQYFGKDLDPYWKKESESLPELLEKAIREYPEIIRRCQDFSQQVYEEAEMCGGEKYAHILGAAYRQAIAAHCICEDEKGDLLFISKECFSNGCSATADISYPSMPLFLLYNPKLIPGMMRPIFRYAGTAEWPFPFAPHDAGTYPLLNGQAYSNGTDPKDQMPVEECGNMLLMACAATLAMDDDSFVKENWELLTTWAEYLRKEGLDPENQLCTDDFAGHLAHNCNLSIKAILGVAAYGLLLKRQGETEKGEEWLTEARSMAAQWIEMAREPDGTYRLAFDRPGSFSMKYNAIWDGLFGTEIFPAGTWDRELASYITRLNPYGMPLDNRAGYTKSDWMVWVASMMGDHLDFNTMIATIWAAYDQMPQRVPLGDWFETEDAWQVQFQNRTVQGGLFMKLLTRRGLTPKK